LLAQSVDPPTGGLLSDMEYFVYVLQNSENKKIYIGQTDNLESRLNRHNGITLTKKISFTFKNRLNESFGMFFQPVFG
jgi:hypothetical protein